MPDNNVDSDDLDFLLGQLDDDDGLDLPFGTGDVTPDSPNGSASLNANGTLSNVFEEQDVFAAPLPARSDLGGVLIFAGLAWLLLKGLK